MKTSWLNGIKGFACLMIMCGHFLGIYGYARTFEPRIRVLDRLLASPAAFLVNEGYWLYLFFVVSGYLVSGSSIPSLRVLIRKIADRFFRLGLPVLFSCVVIYVISIMIGFHGAETETLFDCPWYQTFYARSFTFGDVLFSPVDVLLLGKAFFNGPYWMLRDMFFSAVLIYVLILFRTRIAWREDLFFAMCVVLIVVFGFINDVVSAHLAGMLVFRYADTFSQLTEKSVCPAALLVLALSFQALSASMIPVMFFTSLMILAPRIGFLLRLFNTKPFQALGALSWGVYSFHWPVVSSIGATLMLSLSGHMDLYRAYLTACVVSVCAVLILSTLYHFTLEQITRIMLHRIRIHLSVIP